MTHDDLVTALGELLDQSGYAKLIKALAAHISDRATNGPSEIERTDPRIDILVKLENLNRTARDCDKVENPPKRRRSK